MRAVEEPKPSGRRGMSGYAKAGAYMGLAFITPIAGYIGYVVGLWLAPKVGVSWLDMAGLMLGCASGMYETYRQALRIEGLDRKR
jgi:hypothetical protein